MRTRHKRFPVSHPKSLMNQTTCRRMTCELLCCSPCWWRCCSAMASPQSSSREEPSSTDNLTSFSYSLMISASTMSPGTTQPCRLNKEGQDKFQVLITPLLCVLQAPTMASLAKQGVILEQNYVQPKCAPSRAALMTGETWHPSNLAG